MPRAKVRSRHCHGNHHDPRIRHGNAGHPVTLTPPLFGKDSLAPIN